LERLDKTIFLKLVQYPQEVREIQERIQTRLRNLGQEGLPPMSRREMEEILGTIRELEEHIEAMREEVERIKRRPVYRSFDQVRVLEGKFKVDSKNLASLLLPDPLRSTYRSGGMIDGRSAVFPDATLFSNLLPANRVELFLWVESRRMTDAHFRYFTDEKKQALDEAFDRIGRFPPKAFLRRVTFPDHPYGSPPLGTPDSVARFDLKNAGNHYRAHFGPNRAHIVIVGDVDPDRIFYLAERYFGSLKSAPEAGRDPIQPAGPIIARLFGPRPLVELRYILPGAADADLPALEAFVRHLECGAVLGRAATADGDSLPWRSLEVSLTKGALACLLTLRAKPVDGHDPWPACASLKAALRKAVADGLSPAQLKAARMRWRAVATDRFENPTGLADALALGAARGSWSAVLPGRLDGLEAEGVGKTVRNHLGEAEPVEVLTEVKK
ncbi:MAG: insulinase family protein, partial [Planctomycetota bacterium]